ncbi:MAG TPA: formylglycine-generating enzyme family protein [Noviherbaspirillum sp.]|uniref:formylglycine-generating enzyme family protein n=1 Tax=Noviherbaspirillum sp. TaxID=1926288 RepID=UPI002DDDB2F4|nr:formylglycine-generating enzyme family protein [Noviherbaspirillum sp.]HEV2609456.1 formylglycine-generating enzyme family protein [Noviherbaspirillum sp.]
MSVRSALCIAAGLALPAPGISVASDAGGSAIGKRIDIGAFAVDATEITVGQFARFAAKRQLTSAAEREGGGFEYGAGWERRQGWNYKAPYGKPANDDEPAVHLSWHEAKAYCEDAGGSLPTQAQWSAAAYTEMRASPPSPFMRKSTYSYPTGDTPDGANIAGAADGWERHAPAGRTRPGVNGLYDMGANVWEWLADARDGERLTAGGSWWYDASKMKADGMQFKPADFYAVYVGFWCAYRK